MSGRDSEETFTASAPGKAILFGEHFVVYGISSIICAIDRRVTVRASKSDNIEIHSDMGSLECSPNTYDTSEIAGRTLRPVYDIVSRASREAGYSGGMTLSIRSEIPPGAGLGSSSACCVAASAATLGLLGVGAGADRIIRMASEAERTIFPDASGADTAASALGGMIIYSTSAGYRRIGPGAAGGGLGFGLVVSNSGIAHDTNRIVTRVAEFRRRNESEFGEMCRKEERVVSQALLLLSGDRLSPSQPSPSQPSPSQPSPSQPSPSPPPTTTASELGKLAVLNQEYLKAIQVSNQRIDCMTRDMDRVTHGSKITGAGGGGCVIAFTESDDMEESAGRLVRMGHDCFAAGIDYTGLNTF